MMAQPNTTQGLFDLQKVMGDVYQFGTDKDDAEGRAIRQTM